VEVNKVRDHAVHQQGQRSYSTPLLSLRHGCFRKNWEIGRFNLLILAVS
jgi:hypothetical protein